MNETKISLRENVNTYLSYNFPTGKYHAVEKVFIKRKKWQFWLPKTIYAYHVIQIWEGD